LPVFNQPNVTLVDTRGQGIDGVSEKGVVFDGQEYELDILIMATGFEVQQTGKIVILSRFVALSVSLIQKASLFRHLELHPRRR